MTASATTGLPPAGARVGIMPGWWAAGTTHARPTGHRLKTGPAGGRSRFTVCGRTLTRVRELDADSPGPACEACRKRADRATAASEQDVQPAGPPPSVRRHPSAATAPQPNTAAARTARRAAFAGAFASERVQQYRPQPYGVDTPASRRDAALYPEPEETRCAP